MVDLEYISLIGSGYFCNVKKYKHIPSNNFIALKELKSEHYQKDDYRYRFNREVELLKKLCDCENIIKVLRAGHNSKENKLWYIMPYASQNLFNYIRKNNSKLSDEDRFDIISQVINAIKFAHHIDILHRDLSPNNVLVFEDSGKLTFKVADYGLSKDKESLSYFTGSSASGYGQILYVSPEQYNQLKTATMKSDIFSLGKLIYFIITGKNPLDLKQCILSSLIEKATEDLPQDRFENIQELEEHFLILKDLHFDQEIPIEHLTIKDFLQTKKSKDWVNFHQIAIQGNFSDHVFSDYLEPVLEYLMKNNRINDYYKSSGRSFIEFARTYSEKLNECYGTYHWPFSYMSEFGEFLIKIIKNVPLAEVRLICFKQLWHLAYQSDQWSVQKSIKQVFNRTYISADIATQLSEFIIKSKTKLDKSIFSNFDIPVNVKASIIKSNEIAIKEEEEREKANESLYGDTTF